MQGASFRPVIDAALRGLRRWAEDDPVLLALGALAVLVMFSMIALFASVIVAPALLSVALVEGLERDAGRGGSTPA